MFSKWDLKRQPVYPFVRSKDGIINVDNVMIVLRANQPTISERLLLSIFLSNETLDDMKLYRLDFGAKYRFASHEELYAVNRETLIDLFQMEPMFHRVIRKCVDIILQFGCLEISYARDIKVSHLYVLPLVVTFIRNYIKGMNVHDLTNI